MAGGSSAYGPGEGDDVNRPRARATELDRGRGDRCSGRVHVVDEGDACRRGRCDGEGVAHVATPLLPGETALWPGGLRSSEKPENRKIPLRRELAGKCLRRVLPASQAPLGVAGDERERLGRRSGDDLRDERSELLGQRTQPPLLPAGDERTRRAVVGDRRAGGGEW